MKEYLPRFAGWMAELNYLHGLYPLNHTQNTLIRVNKKTGKIIGFAFRDMRDLMVDPAIRLIHGQKLPDKDLISSGLVLPRVEFLDNFVTAKIESHWGLYSSQSVDKIFHSFDSSLDGTSSFLQEYIKQVERLLNIKLTLTPEAKRILESRGLKGTEFILEARYGPAVASIFSIMREIHQQVIHQKMPTLTDKMTNYNQKLLKIAFLIQKSDLGNTKSIIKFRKDVGEKRRFSSIVKGYGYAFDGQGVFQYDRSNGQVLEYVYNLPTTTIKKIKDFSFSTKSGSLSTLSCLKLLLKFKNKSQM